MKARLSIWGLNQYRPDIFDNMVLPAGVDRALLVDTICTELSDLSLIYPNPDMLKSYIGTWSAVHLPTWEKLYNTTVLEYDPISNYDRTETWTDTATNSGSGIDKTAGFNSTEMVERNSSTATGNSTGTHEGHIFGNIGVTTTQQMIESERNVAQFNIYSFITEQFKTRFCVMVY